MNETVQQLSTRIADHAKDKHLKEFDDPKFGVPQNIRDERELAKHTEKVLESKDTRCFTSHMTERPDRQADHYYHSSSNTMVTVPLNINDPPTTYRPKEGEAHYERKLDNADKLEKHRTITEKQGIHELHPEMKRDQAPTKEQELPNSPQQRDPDKVQNSQENRFKHDAPREAEKPKPSQGQAAPEKAQELQEYKFKHDTPREAEKQQPSQEQKSNDSQDFAFKRDTARDQNRGR